MSGPRLRAAVALGGFALLAIGTAACTASATPGGGAGAQPSPPALVTARAVGGSPGKGPTVIASPVPLPGGGVTSQKVTLNDRTLIITSVTTHEMAASKGSVFIDLRLSVRNLSGKAIRNRAVFFELTGSGGDSFSYQDRVSAGFYGAIAAHASHSGVIEFKIPAAAVTGLYLQYRPEIASESVITRLNVG